MTENLNVFIHVWDPAQNPDVAVTLLLLHGTGGSETDLVGLGKTLLPSANMLSPRGRVSERGMARFFRRIAEGVFDLEDLALRTDELAGFIQAASAAYRFDSERVVAVGFSNGANIGASLLLKHPQVLLGAVLMRAMTPFEPAQLPDLHGKEVLIESGTQDPLVSQEDAENLRSILVRSGAGVQLSWQKASHQLTQGDLDTAKAFLARIDQSLPQ